MKKKPISVLLAAAMTAGLLAGCGSNNAKPAETPAETPAATTAKAETGETTAAPAAAEGDKKYEGVEHDYTRISKNYVNYVADLTDMAKAAGYADKSYAVFNNQATEWAGFLPCITEQPSVGGVFYNKDIFDDCGITAPATWDEFMTACQTMKDKGYQPLALDSTYAPFLFVLLYT